MIPPILDSHSIPTKDTLSGFWFFSSQVHYFSNDSTQVHVNAIHLYAPESTTETSCVHHQPSASIPYRSKTWKNITPAIVSYWRSRRTTATTHFSKHLTPSTMDTMHKLQTCLLSSSNPSFYPPLTALRLLSPLHP